MILIRRFIRFSVIPVRVDFRSLMTSQFSCYPCSPGPGERITL